MPGSPRLVGVINFAMVGGRVQSDYWVSWLVSSPGPVTVEFWAIDSTGTVAVRPETFSFLVTPPESPRPSSLRTVEKFVKMSVVPPLIGGYVNFDLSGRRTDFTTIRIGDGFYTNVVVGGFSVDQRGLSDTPIGGSGVIVSGKVVGVGPAAVVVFTLRNTKSVSQSADLSLYSTRIQIGNGVSSSGIDRGSGFIGSGDGDQLTFVGRNSPFVSNVSSYWFGHYFGTIDNLYLQVGTGDSYSGPLLGVSLAWKNQLIPAGESISIATIVTWGDRTPIPDLSGIRLESGGRLTGTISSAYNYLVYFFFVFDGNASTVSTSSAGVWPGESFSVSVCDFSPAGSHRLEVYGVYASGGVSPPSSFDITCSGKSQGNNDGTRQGTSDAGATAMGIVIPLVVIGLLLGGVVAYFRFCKNGEADYSVHDSLKGHELDETPVNLFKLDGSTLPDL
jgi:hypothetical protein